MAGTCLSWRIYQGHIWDIHGTYLFCGWDMPVQKTPPTEKEINTSGCNHAAVPAESTWASQFTKHLMAGNKTMRPLALKELAAVYFLCSGIHGLVFIDWLSMIYCLGTGIWAVIHTLVSVPIIYGLMPIAWYPWAGVYGSIVHELVTMACCLWTGQPWTCFHSISPTVCKLIVCRLLMVGGIRDERRVSFPFTDFTYKIQFKAPLLERDPYSSPGWEGPLNHIQWAEET